jgi:hypothetical protein
MPDLAERGYKIEVSGSSAGDGIEADDSGR